MKDAWRGTFRALLFQTECIFLRRTKGQTEVIRLPVGLQLKRRSRLVATQRSQKKVD